MTDKGEKRKNKIDGFAFWKSLRDCNSAEEIFELLGETLGSEKMIDRAKNISDLPAIVNLNAATARAKIDIKSKSYFSSQNCMDMAVAKYCKLTGNSIKQFKIENNKYATLKAMNEKVDKEKQPVVLKNNLQYKTIER